MTKRVPAFTKETDLCAAFIAAISPDWVAYPETAGWDILLVRRADGFQVGIQAKLKLNARVMAQAVEPYFWSADRPGPDCRAVLVPEDTNSELAALGPYCVLTVIRMFPPEARAYEQFVPSLPRAKANAHGYLSHHEHWYELMPTTRHKLPEFVPDVAAGASAPMQLTDWKIRAIRLAVLLDQTGILLRSDFTAKRVDIRRWIGQRWIVPGEDGFVAGAMPDFRGQHPSVWAQIAAVPEQWQRVAQRLLIRRAVSVPLPL